MAEFVRFTLEGLEEPIAINVDHIVYCLPEGEGTRICLTKGAEMTVTLAFKQVLSAIGPRTDSYGQRVD